MAQLTTSDRGAIVDDVRRFLRDYQNAVSSGDLAAIAQLYDDDPAFHWIENGKVSYESHAALVAVFKGFQSSVQELQLSVRDTRIEPLAPTVANVSGSYSQVFIDQAGKRYETAGAMTLVVVRRDSGWRILMGHVSQEPKAE